MRVEPEPPIDDVAGDVDQPALVRERVRPEPDQRDIDADPELDADHPGCVVHCGLMMGHVGPTNSGAGDVTRSGGTGVLCANITTDHRHCVIEVIDSGRGLTQQRPDRDVNGFGIPEGVAE